MCARICDGIRLEKTTLIDNEIEQTKVTGSTPCFQAAGGLVVPMSDKRRKLC